MEGPSTFQQFVDWAFLSIIGGGVAFGAKFLGDLSRNVASLNEKLTGLIERVGWHEKEIRRLSENTERLENKHSRG